MRSFQLIPLMEIKSEIRKMFPFAGISISGWARTWFTFTSLLSLAPFPIIPCSIRFFITPLLYTSCGFSWPIDKSSLLSLTFTILFPINYKPQPKSSLYCNKLDPWSFINWTVHLGTLYHSRPAFSMSYFHHFHLLPTLAVWKFLLFLNSNLLPITVLLYI